METSNSSKLNSLSLVAPPLSVATEDEQSVKGPLQVPDESNNCIQDVSSQMFVPVGTAMVIEQEKLAAECANESNMDETESQVNERTSNRKRNRIFKRSSLRAASSETLVHTGISKFIERKKRPKDIETSQHKMRENASKDEQQVKESQKKLNGEHSRSWIRIFKKSL